MNRYSFTELEAYNNWIQVQNKIDSEMERLTNISLSLPWRSKMAFEFYLSLGSIFDEFLPTYEVRDFEYKCERLFRLITVAKRLEPKCQSLI